MAGTLEPHHIGERVRQRLRPTYEQAARLWPTIEQELAPYRSLFKGRVLNAGAGDRDLSALFDDCQIVNQDIEAGHHLGHIDLWGPLDHIDVPDGYFDGIICNAVLEHVADPESVMAEFARVTHPGSVLYLGVPFLQPEHLDPTDYQRYTADGLRSLAVRHGFVVHQLVNVHPVETTVGWVLQEWLAKEQRIPVLLGGRAAFEYLARSAGRSSQRVHSVASAYAVIAYRIDPDADIDIRD